MNTKYTGSFSTFSRKICSNFIIIGISALLLPGCKNKAAIPQVQQWTTHEITLISKSSYENGYTDIDVWAHFTNGNGDTLLRPAFWDGGNMWKIRFAPPDTGSAWSWSAFSVPSDKGLYGKRGSLRSVAYTGSNPLLKHGLLRMSEGKRNVIMPDLYQEHLKASALQTWKDAGT